MMSVSSSGDRDWEGVCGSCQLNYDSARRKAKMLRCYHTFCSSCLERCVASSPSGNGVVCPSCYSSTSTLSVYHLPDNPYVLFNNNNNQVLPAPAPAEQPPFRGIDESQVYEILESSLGKIEAFILYRGRKVEEVVDLREMLGRLGAKTQEILVSNQRQLAFLGEVQAQLGELKKRMEENVTPGDFRSLSLVYEKALELRECFDYEVQFSQIEDLKDSLHNSKVRVEFEQPSEYLSRIGAGQDKLIIDLSSNGEDDSNVALTKKLLVDILAFQIGSENHRFKENVRNELEAKSSWQQHADDLSQEVDTVGDDSVIFSSDEEDSAQPSAVTSVHSTSRSSLYDDLQNRPSFSEVAKLPAVATPTRPKISKKISKKILRARPMPHCFFQIQVDAEPPFRVVFELRPDKAPKMVENFQRLCSGLPNGRGYRGSRLHQVKTDDFVAGGDVENNDGSGGHSSYDEKHFLADQCTLKNHKGALRMRGVQRTIDGRCRVGSQFMIWVEDLTDKDFKYSLVFGAVVEGLEELRKVSRLGSRQKSPNKWVMKNSVTIIDSGIL